MIRAECRLCLWKSLIRDIELAEKNVSSAKVRVHIGWVVCKDREVRAQLCQQDRHHAFQRSTAACCNHLLDCIRHTLHQDVHLG